MKLIDLFVKIANGEKTPNIIKFGNMIFKTKGKEYNYYCEEENKLLEDSFIFEELNDEVEIIEDTPKVQVEMTQEEYNEYLDRKLNTPKEDKKIEKFYFSVYQDQKLGGREVVETLETKINEIIDKINKGEENE